MKSHTSLFGAVVCLRKTLRIAVGSLLCNDSATTKRYSRRAKVESSVSRLRVTNVQQLVSLARFVLNIYFIAKQTLVSTLCAPCAVCRKGVPPAFIKKKRFWIFGFDLIFEFRGEGFCICGKYATTHIKGQVFIALNVLRQLLGGEFFNPCRLSVICTSIFTTSLAHFLSFFFFL